MKADSADVVVVGAGVAGASVAYRLAKAGLDVLVLDRAGTMAEVSSANTGLSWLLNRASGLDLEFGRASYEMWSELPDELECCSDDLEMVKTGAFLYIDDDDYFERAPAFVELRRQEGMDATLLDRKQAKSLEPHLSDTVAGAVVSPDGYKFDTFRVCEWYIRAAKNNGARFQTRREMLALRRNGHRVTGVTTVHGDVAAGTVVIAAGIAAPRIVKSLGIDLPLKAGRLQVLVTEPIPSLLGRPVSSATKVVPFLDRVDPERTKQKLIDKGLSIAITERGNLLLTSSTDYPGLDKRTSLEAVRSVAQNVIRILPEAGSVNIIRTFANFKPLSADGFPILGRVPDVPGLILATGFGGTGMLLSPLVSSLLAELIVDGKNPVALEPFSIQRFARRPEAGGPAKE